MADDLLMLNQIVETLNRAVDVRGALDMALARLVEVMGLETGWIFVVEPLAQERWAGRGYQLAAHHHLPPALAVDKALAWDKGCDCQGFCDKGKLTEAYNEVTCSRLAESVGDRRGLVVHASAPLRAGERVLGILNVAAASWEAFSPQALALLTNVGNHMGVALERARLYELLREQRVLEQATLLELSSQMLGRPELDELMGYVVAEVQRLLVVDACAILLPDRHEPEWLVFRAAVGWRSDPVAHGYRIRNDASTGSGRVMASQRPLWVQDESDRERLPHLQADPELWAWIRVEAFESAAVVPLVSRGQSIGALLIDSRKLRRFTAEEIRFLQLMANQAAIALEQARLRRQERQQMALERSLALGREIQESMLPQACPALAGWQFAAVYEAAQEVGGDFYDFFQLAEGPDEWGLVIADVSDKGIPAALFMALCRTTIRNSALRGWEPAQALTMANQFIQEDSWADMFVSAFYGVLAADGRFQYTNAGHNPPLWWHGGRCQWLASDGIVLGVLPQIGLVQHEMLVAPGDVLVFFTDGVTEAMTADKVEFGEGRLETAVSDLLAARPEATADEVLAAIQRAIDLFTRHAPQHDDITLFVVKRE
ncbi:MAG: SpoIIE family protein phosphatase [Ardenticatenaceae bacterium]|nr:SpoIIE family protein phosphatase [Ardenticatenaceae bacterium]